MFLSNVCQMFVVTLLRRKAQTSIAYKEGTSDESEPQKKKKKLKENK